MIDSELTMEKTRIAQDKGKKLINSYLIWIIILSEILTSKVDKNVIFWPQKWLSHYFLGENSGFLTLKKVLAVPGCALFSESYDILEVLKLSATIPWWVWNGFLNHDVSAPSIKDKFDSKTQDGGQWGVCLFNFLAPGQFPRVSALRAATVTPH